MSMSWGGQFTLSSSSWLEGSKSCGHNGHSYYTFSTTNPPSSDNWGIWRPNVAEFGYYRLEMYVPYCFTGTGETEGAVYEVSHFNGQNQVPMSHEQGIGQWNHLGNYVLGSGADDSIYLDDLVTTDNGQGVWFDGLRFVRLPDPEDSVLLLQPPDHDWVNETQIELQWQLVSLNSTEAVTVEIGTDADMTNIVATETWDTAVSTYTFTHSNETTWFYWRVTAAFQQEDDSINTVSSTTNQFGIDENAPTSEITAVYKMPEEGRYLINWTGSDDLSGIADYTIEYRVISDTTWLTLQAGIVETTSFFNAPDPAEQYEFRTLATDVAGNSQSPDDTSASAINTENAVALPNAVMIPIVIKSGE